MKTINGFIDTAQELDAISRFLKSRWTIADNESFDKVLKNVWLKSLSMGQSNYYYGINYILKTLDDVKSKFDDDIEKTRVFETLVFILASKHCHSPHQQKNLENIEKYIEEQLVETPEVKLIKPNDWDKYVKLSQSYPNEYTLLEQYRSIQEKVDNKAFEGVNTKEYNRGFCLETSLANVLYEVQEQGGDPAESLFYSVFLHAYICQDMNNTFELLKSMKQLEVDIAEGKIRSAEEISVFLNKI